MAQKSLLVITATFCRHLFLFGLLATKQMELALIISAQLKLYKLAVNKRLYGITEQVNDGERIHLIGANGAGKIARC